MINKSIEFQLSIFHSVICFIKPTLWYQSLDSLTRERERERQNSFDSCCVSMATNTTSSNTLPSVPLLIFKGDGYEFWSVRMKSLLMSHDLWDLVNVGYNSVDQDRLRLAENKKKDAKALYLIQQAVHDDVFSRIAAAVSARQAWNVLQTEFQGDSKVKTVKLQTLRREFETLQMKDSESVADFLSKVMKNVNQKRSYGETVSDQTVVEKVLRSLPAKWDHVVTAIEESKDLTTLSFDRLMGSLQAHEGRVNRGLENVTEGQAFQAKEDEGSSYVRGRGRTNLSWTKSWSWRQM